MTTQQEAPEIELHYYKPSAKNEVFKAAGYICVLIGISFFIYFGFFALFAGFAGVLGIMIAAAVPFFGGMLILGLAKGLDLLVEIRDLLKEQHKENIENDSR